MFILLPRKNKFQTFYKQSFAIAEKFKLIYRSTWLISVNIYSNLIMQFLFFLVFSEDQLISSVNQSTQVNCKETSFHFVLLVIY